MSVEGKDRASLALNSHSIQIEMSIATKPLVTASEITGLEPLRSYVKQENRVVAVKFAFVPKRSLQPEFIERMMSISDARPVKPAVVPEVLKAAAPPTKPLPAAVDSVPKLKLATPVSAMNSEAALRLFTKPVAEETSEPELRKSAFKKKEGTAREWKPVD